MKKTILLSLLILATRSYKLAAQTPVSKLGPCDCEMAFKDLVDKLENNYIGLAQLKMQAQDKAYQEVKDRFLETVGEIEAAACTAFMNDFLGFFEDGHLFAFEFPKYTEEEIMTFKAKIKAEKVNVQRLDELAATQKGSDPIPTDRLLGNWTDGRSDFRIVKTGKKYKAYILRTKVDGVEVGECKAIFSPEEEGFTATYYSYGYSPRFISGDIYKEGTLLVASNILWRRVQSSFDRELAAIHPTDFKLPTFQQLDEKHILLSIPSFIVDFSTFKEFIKAHEKRLKKTENLIIDIRGNRGGNGIYFPLIELFATQNMEGSQGQVLASEDNRAYFDRQKKYSAKIYGPVVERIDNQMGEIVDGPLYPGKKFKPIKSQIKNVAILTDQACMSAAESFILHAKRSSAKVKTFGSPTNGVIDYTSVNSLLLDSGKQSIYFGYPTSTLHKEIPKNGYNATGMIPDVPIPTAVQDKVKFIVEYLQ